MPRQCAAERILKSCRVAGEVQLLENQGHATTIRARLVQAPMLTTVGDGARLVRTHPRQGLQQSGLASAGPTNDCHKPTSRNLQIKIPDKRSSASLQGQPLDPKMRRFNGDRAWKMWDQGWCRGTMQSVMKAGRLVRRPGLTSSVGRVPSRGVTSDVV
jgi:hypothetical protein